MDKPFAYYIESNATPGECWELIEGREPVEYVGDDAFTIRPLYTTPARAEAQDEDTPCTDCGDTGVTHQTERRCSCQEAEAQNEGVADTLIDDEWRALVGDGPDTFANPASINHDEFRTAIRGVLSRYALLSARPLVLGGQQGEASVRDMRLSHWAEVEPFPARAEAQDEGAAGVPIEDLWQELCERDDRTSPEEYPEMCLITFDELSDFITRAHPSPPPAADEDRVRIAVEALERVNNTTDRATGYSDLSARRAAHKVAAEALAALKSEGK